jgi:hypothetical protein
MNTLSTITVLPSTNDEINHFVESAKAEILSGNTDPLVIKRQLKAFREVIKNLEEDEEIKDYILTEALKYNGKTFDHACCKFQIRETPVYEYTFCNDSELNQLKAKLEMIKEQVKAREKWLQSLKEPFTNEETGEIIKPPAKKSTTVIAITLT